MWMAHYLVVIVTTLVNHWRVGHHTPYYSIHLALSVSSPSHRIKIEEQGDTLLLNSPALDWCLELAGLNDLSDQIWSLSCELIH